jgi:hypothetical protein
LLVDASLHLDTVLPAGPQRGSRQHDAEQNEQDTSPQWDHCVLREGKCKPQARSSNFEVPGSKFEAGTGQTSLAARSRAYSDVVTDRMDQALGVSDRLTRALGEA